MINISKGIEIIKFIPKYLFPIVIFSGSIIFASEEFLNSLGIEKLVTDYRSWFSIVFLGSSAFLTSYTLIHIAKFIYRQFQYFFIVLTGKRRPKKLTPDEIEILSIYIADNTRTQKLDFSDGTVINLEKQHIIYRAARTGELDFMDSSFSFSFNIQTWAWNYLNKKKELLGLINREQEKNEYLNVSKKSISFTKKFFKLGHYPNFSKEFYHLMIVPNKAQDDIPALGRYGLYPVAFFAFGAFVPKCIS